MPITEAQGDEIIDVLKDILSELTRIGVNVNRIDDNVAEVKADIDGINDKLLEIASEVSAMND